MERKALFFDIDGTLKPIGAPVPDSARQALKKAAENGHFLFLCTGRGPHQIDEEVKSIGFDGGVYSAGANVILHGEYIVHACFSEEQGDLLFSVLEQTKTAYFLHGTGQEVTDTRSKKYFFEAWKKFGLRGDWSTFWKDRVILDDPEERRKVFTSMDTAIYAGSSLTVPQMNERIEKAGLLATGSTVDLSNGRSGEITMRSFTKATGIRAMLEALHLEREDSIAFGDGPNDIGMMQAAGIGVAMGNGTQECRAAADLVTADAGKDGIRIAMEKLGLI